MKIKLIVTWIFRLLAAYIMLQTLYFKFTAHPQSVMLFTQLGMEPAGTFQPLRIADLPPSVTLGPQPGVTSEGEQLFANTPRKIPKTDGARSVLPSLLSERSG